ncbi:MAG: CrcB family protein [Desulfovibrionaceae bacterium]|nr:CrcB family protein [Desulfovibrionaceae bacterium]
MTQTASPSASGSSKAPASIAPAAAVMLGGAAGAVCRFSGNSAITALAGGAFPLGILLINVAGGFLMGLLQGAIARSGRPHALLYSLLGTGFLGGFTTFSSFALDTARLYASGNALSAALNIMLNACLAIMAAGLGFGICARRGASHA